MNRKFFIGLVLPLEANNQARLIAEDLVKTYGIKDQFKKYPPHITLKISFEGTEAQKETIIAFLNAFVRGRRDIVVELSDFGHFNIGVIYWDVIQHSEALTTLQIELCDGLQEQFPWVTFYPVEPNGIPHITVGEGDIRGRFKEIYSYLKEYHKPSRHAVLNEIHLFEKLPAETEWHSAATFALQPSF